MRVTKEGPSFRVAGVKRILLTVGMLLMGMGLVGGAAAALVPTSLLPLDQEVGTHTSAAGAVLGIGLMAAAVNPSANIGWVRAGILYGFADSNIVKHNAVRGAARAALSIPSVFPLPPCLAMRAATPSTWKKHSQDSRRLKSVRDFVDAGVRR